MQSTKHSQNGPAGTFVPVVSPGPSTLDEPLAFTHSLLKLAARLDSFGNTSPSPAEPVELTSEEQYALIRR